MKRKGDARATKGRRTAVVPGMIFGLGAALTPVVPGCGVGNRTPGDAGGAAADLSIRRIDFGVMVPPSPDFAIGVMVNPDFAVEDRGAAFDTGVMIPPDLTVEVPDLGVPGDGGNDGPGGDR